MILSAVNRVSNVFDFVEKGKTVLHVLLSIIDPEFPNIFVTLPSIKEANLINSLILQDPKLEDEVHTEIIRRCVVNLEERKWLLQDAPAGLATSIAKELIKFSSINSSEHLTELLNLTRYTTKIFDQFQAILNKETGMTLQEIENMDLIKALRTIVNIEQYMLAKGELRDILRISGENNSEEFDKELENMKLENLDPAAREIVEEIRKTRQKTKEKKDRKAKNPGAIDFDQENFRLAMAGGAGMLKNVDPMEYNIYTDDEYLEWNDPLEKMRRRR